MKKKKPQQLLTQDCGRSPLIAKSFGVFPRDDDDEKKKKNKCPVTPSLPLKIRAEGGGLSAVPSTLPASPLRLLFLRARTASRATGALAVKCGDGSGQSAPGAGQNAEWSGRDFRCSHPGARTVLCVPASAVISRAAHQRAGRHMLGGGPVVVPGGRMASHYRTR